MKRPILISPLVLLSGLFFVLFMISCGKDGKDGANGADGATGPAGPKGDAGSSGNVIYSAWLDVPYLPDTVHRVGGKIDTIGYYASISAPKLTQALLSTADVKVFFNANDVTDPVIYPLPYVAPTGLNIRFLAYTQNIQLDANGDVSTYTNNGKKYYQYRYMIVPGNNQARAAAPVNWSDYAAVKAYLGLKD